MHKGLKVKEILKSKKISTEEFSKLIGISKAYAYDIFEKEHIGTELLEKISDTLGVSVHVFFVEAEREIIIIDKNIWEEQQKENDSLKQAVKELNEKLTHKEELLQTNTARISELKSLLLAYEEISRSLKGY